jgi:capsular polysaccharide transport system permease protein
MPEAIHARQTKISVTLAEPERAPLTPQDASLKAKSIALALRRAANKSRAPTRVITGGGGFQARRGDRAFRLGVLASFAAFVIAPFLVASIYWGLIASKQYVTETKFALRAGEASSLDLLSGGGIGSQAS